MAIRLSGRVSLGVVEPGKGWICVDLDTARNGTRASYERCAAYVVSKLEPTYVREDFACLVVVQAAVSMAGCARADQAPRHVFGPQRLMWGTDWPISEPHTPGR